MGDNLTVEKDYGTRIICAKLYQGGLWSAYSILSNLERMPFTGRSPEIGLDSNLITKHAESALKYHLNFALIAAGVTILGLITYPFNSIISGFIIALVVASIVIKSKYLDTKIAIDNFSRKAYNPSYGLEGSSITKDSGISDNKQNVVIFGGYSPFVGAGHRIANWNYSIDLSKPSKSIDGNSACPQDVTIEELYNSVDEEINAKNLPNISQEFILFAEGREITSKSMLSSKISDPISYLEPKIVILEGHKSLYNEYRTYYSIKYFDKVRSTLLSAYLRFFKIGNELFIESCFYALPPIDENIFDIDKTPLYSDLFKIKAGIYAAALSIASFILIAFNVSAQIPFIIVPIATFWPLLKLGYSNYNKKAIRKNTKKSIDKGQPHNYGIIRTFRESISSANFRNYFSAQDRIMIQSSIDQAIICAIAEYLDSKCIDSSSLKSELMAVINKGIIVGGDLNAEDIFVGDKSKKVTTIQSLQEHAKNITRTFNTEKVA